MPLKDFTEETWGKLIKGDEQIPVGMTTAVFDGFETKRLDMFYERLTKM